MNIRETLQQLGGQGLGSALAYTGTSQIFDMTNNNAVGFKVNGRRGYKTYIIVQLAGNDTYTVTLKCQRGYDTGAVYEREHDVYCDELQDVFESIYDAHMNKMNNGFIPLS